MSKKRNNVFFMEIFNDILKINDNNIMIVYDKDGYIWFGLSDIIKSLGYTDVSHAKKYLQISKTNKNKFCNIKVWGRPHTLIIQPHKLFINESGLYESLSISTKPLAKLFMNRYFTDIMPKIREKWKIYFR